MTTRPKMNLDCNVCFILFYQVLTADSHSQRCVHVWTWAGLGGFQEAGVSTALQNCPEMSPSLKGMKKCCVCEAKTTRQMVPPGLEIALDREPASGGLFPTIFIGTLQPSHGAPHGPKATPPVGGLHGTRDLSKRRHLRS